MSSTRKTIDEAPARQERWASSSEFERGLLANLVARRCALLDDAPDRELIWAIQKLSHPPIGLTQLGSDLLKAFPERLQTAQMAAIGKRAGAKYTADEVKAVRSDLPQGLHGEFLLKGEYEDLIYGGATEFLAAITEKNRHELFYEEMKEVADRNPTSYPVSKFLEPCRQASTHETSGIAEQLKQLCLDPSFKPRDGKPWYFPTFVSTLREYFAAQSKAIADRTAVTTLGEKVYDTLDYTLYSHRMTLMQGNPRLGKSFAARTWCELHPGSSRYVEVPPSNDEASFFRAIARGLGLGNFLQYKVAEIKERVESVLLTGDLLLCLDEASRCWPQTNFRYSFPARINWVMAMANHSVPICLISTPDFIERQKITVQKTGWDDAQLIGRIGHYEPLPETLEERDLMAVAKSVFPEADAKVLRALAVYARSSARYLAAIDSISARAKYIAKRDGRDVATAEDVRTAMKESVIPADSKLQTALASGKQVKSRRRPVQTQLPIRTEESEPPPRTRGNELPEYKRDARPIETEQAA